MNSDLKTEDILSQVRAKLNKDNIKLWLAPYNSDNGVQSDEEQAIQLLSQQLAEDLNISQECCITAVKELQHRALANLKSCTVFKQTGVASLKIKISGKDPVTVVIDIILTSNTEKLIQEISEKVAIPTERIKLISNGRVLQAKETLLSQGLKNGSQLMAVLMDEKGTLQEAEKRLKAVKRIKKDLKLVAGQCDSNNDMYFQIEDQSGKILNIPPLEHKALVTAMTLHEKGRAALKKEDYALALVMFLEADEKYSNCRSELLNACDNYALLHLDISWCYLCLRNPAQIPDAENRLILCEQNFHRSYGENMERLLAIKGTTGNEMCLFMRLHLLQGVVHFHQNRRIEAKRLFEKALSELIALKVDDNIALLMELGYSSTEARIGLRATNGNIELAEELISRKRKERELAWEQNEQKEKLDKERRMLGLCQDGKQYCDPILVNQLEAMGFKRYQSIDALKLANNVASEAVSIIQDTPHLLPKHVSEELLTKLTSLGYEVSTVEELLASGTSQSLEKVIKSLSSIVDSSGASCSTADSNVSKSASAITFIEDLRKKHKLKKEEKKAFKRLSKDLAGNDLSEDHLDMNLEQEEQILKEYMSLLD